MLLTHMRPDQLQAAVSDTTPVIMASGVIEYHGPHLPIGTDILIPQALCEELERRCDCVLAPPISFGPTGSWAGPAREGEADLPTEAFLGYSKAVLRCLHMGFTRIYVMPHHQSLDGAQGLSLRLAAKQLALEDGRASGIGWGRKPLGEGAWPGVFQRIQVKRPWSFIPDDELAAMPGDHAGQGETQLTMAAAPETIDMTCLPPTDSPSIIPWLRTSHKRTRPTARSGSSGASPRGSPS